MGTGGGEQDIAFRGEVGHGTDKRDYSMQGA